MRRIALLLAAPLVAALALIGALPSADAVPLTSVLADAPVSNVRQDPISLVTALSGRIIHGDRHNGRDRDELLSLLKKGDLSLTCGPAVDFVRGELELLGVAARNVQLTSPLPHNGYDDGHILLEVETTRGPVLVDVDQKRLFLIDGKPASEATVRARGFDAVDLQSLPVPARVDPAFAYADYMEKILADPRPWYRRMFAG